jgi:hypothetical protein
MELREAQAAVSRQCRYRAPCLLLEITDALYADATRWHFERDMPIMRLCDVRRATLSSFIYYTRVGRRVDESLGMSPSDRGGAFQRER